MAGRADAPSYSPTGQLAYVVADAKGSHLEIDGVAVTGDDIVRVQLAAVPFAGVIDWLDEMQRTASLSTIEANVVALPEAGQVNATLTLRQQKSE